jgi:pSer/pThr/pTyr-binding forkhead associated (FHA) protein
MMNKDNEKTVITGNATLSDIEDDKGNFSSTMAMSKNTFIGKIPTLRQAVLEIMGEDPRQFILREEDVIIGRIPECGFQLPIENVSRKHACIHYHNEEYEIEDLNSTNGIYVNGIKVEKCVLRNHDLIEVGGVKIQFLEKRIRQEN